MRLFPLLLLAACIDFGDPVGPYVPPPPEVEPDDTGTPPTDTGTTARVGVEHIVEMENNTFVPDEITITAGDWVTWVNNDPGFHIVGEGEPGDPTTDWTSPSILGGERWSYTFDDPGSVIYFCTNHAAIMRDAWVHVEAP